MGSQDTFNLGDKVWYEAEDGNRYLMVVKATRDNDKIDLYPHDATSSLLKDKSESRFTFIHKSYVQPATAATEGTLMQARKVAEFAMKMAAGITEAKGVSLSHAQTKLVNEAIVQGFLEMKQDFSGLEASGFFDRLK